MHSKSLRQIDSPAVCHFLQIIIRHKVLYSKQSLYISILCFGATIFNLLELFLFLFFFRLLLLLLLLPLCLEYLMMTDELKCFSFPLPLPADM